MDIFLQYIILLSKVKKMNEEIINKIKFLTDVINKANYDYYNLNISELTDQQYDASLQELISLEKKYPEYRLKYSPTFKIGGVVNSKFKKIVHEVPMLSLENVFDIEELKLFYNRICKKTSHFNFITELKIDGVAINLKYEKGILIQATTRGNGQVGESVIDNIKTIKNIPLKLNKDIDLEVRGEIFFKHDNFQKLNNLQIKNNKKTFSNPRNAASGTIRLFNSDIVSQRILSSFFYHIVKPPEFIKTQKEILNFLNEMGFSVNPYHYVVDSFEDLIFQINKYKKIKDNLNYDTDGVVIKINQLSLYSLIGYTSKFPKWAIAYKFNSSQSETIVKKISFQVGRTGSITPVAELLPVMVGGSVISNVSLHNYNYIKKKDIRIGDTVLIHKSGSIIPEIIEVIKSKRTNKFSFEMITRCPFCKSELEKKTNEVDYFCLNDYCEEKQIKKIIHFVSREAMNVNILGKKTLILFFKKGFIKKISDLYSLKKFYSELKELPCFKTKKVNNILNALENSKSQPFKRVLFGLGIKHIGIKAAKILSQKYTNIFALKEAKKKDLLEIPEVGIKIVTSLEEYFKNSKNWEEINILLKHNIKFKIEEKNKITAKDNFFKDKKIVLTGSLIGYSRKEITILLKEKGALIFNSVSKNVDYLICGKDSGSKLKKAVILDIKIINEEELEKRLYEK
jgi:DNA ligase (NAD+)